MKVISPARRTEVCEKYVAGARQRNVIQLVRKVRTEQANPSAWARVKAYLNEEVTF